MLTLRGEHFCFLGPFLRGLWPAQGSEEAGEACSNVAVPVVFGHFDAAPETLNYLRKLL